MTVSEIKERICDDYCKMVDICETQERLDRHCAECPLNELQEGSEPE